MFSYEFKEIFQNSDSLENFQTTVSTNCETIGPFSFLTFFSFPFAVFSLMVAQKVDDCGEDIKRKF